MKKLIVILVIVGLLAIIPLGIALAQTTSQTTSSTPNPSWVDEMAAYCQDIMGGGMMGGGGGGGRGMMGW